MECLGSFSIVKGLTLVPKQHNASDITRPGEAGMNWRSCCRAVAAATGRGFKSSRPDVASRIGKFGYIGRISQG
jgi:hypothetical protein